MNRLIRAVALTALPLSCTFACVAPGPAQEDDGAVDGPARETAEELTKSSSIVRPVCASAWTAPTFTTPANDGVALSRLLEGAGWGASTNSDWTDMTSGNFCGGAEKELVLVKNAASQFSVMRGPTPYPVGTFKLDSDANHPWRAVTAGDLDGDGYDELVAVRKVTAAGVPDLEIAKVDRSSCDGATVVGTANVGNTANSEWLDLAIGNFDGSGKQIAMLKAAPSNLFLARFSPGGISASAVAGLDASTTYPWRALAAGDLDGDGIDELVAARKVSDGVGATVLVYKWVRGAFRVAGTSTFGNTGNSDWSGITVGDFNGDGHKTIAVVKNAHSNFAILDWTPASTVINVIATNNLDSVAGQNWRAVTAVDWMGGDNGATELVAVRAAVGAYRADLFVYGNAFHRAARESAQTGQRATWDEPRDIDIATIVKWAVESNVNTINWHLSSPNDYPRLVELLEATKTVCAPGRRKMRVAVTLVPERVAQLPDNCSQPVDSPLTAWNELAYFNAPAGSLANCGNTLAWGSLIGRLAVDYPHLIGIGIDDLLHYPDMLAPEVVAELQSRMRSQAPWLSFVPTGYYDDLTRNPPDMARTFDTMLYYFRGDYASQRDGIEAPCLDAKRCDLDGTISTVPYEVKLARAFLPAGRKLQVGTYWATHGSGPTMQETTARYSHDLVRMLRNLPDVDGVTAYPMQTNPGNVVCDEYNALKDKYCALRKAYGAPAQPVTATNLTAAFGAPLATGNPASYAFAAQGTHNVVYRASNGHAYAIWRTATGIGRTDLTALAGAPNVTGDPAAYAYPAQNMNNVLYRGSDNHVYDLFWTTGAVGKRDLTALAGAPNAAGPPHGVVFAALGVQNAVYRADNGRLYSLWWSSGATVGRDDLTTLSGAPKPMVGADPFSVVFDSLAVENALYRGNDNHLHSLYWSTGAVGHDDLTALSGAPLPAGNVKSYIATTYNLENALYRGEDGHVHGLYWSTGAVGHDDLTWASHAPLPKGDPTGYFVAADGSHHVVYRDVDGHVQALAWTVGVVTRDDLTLLAGAPNAASEPTAYVAPDGSHHVVYRSSDNHLHDLSFR